MHSLDQHVRGIFSPSAMNFPDHSMRCIGGTVQPGNARTVAKSNAGSAEYVWPSRTSGWVQAQYPAAKVTLTSVGAGFVRSSFSVPHDNARSTPVHERPRPYRTGSGGLKVPWGIRETLVIRSLPSLLTEINVENTSLLAKAAQPGLIKFVLNSFQKQTRHRAHIISHPGKARTPLPQISRNQTLRLRPCQPFVFCGLLSLFWRLFAVDFQFFLQTT